MEEKVKLGAIPVAIGCAILALVTFLILVFLFNGYLCMIDIELYFRYAGYIIKDHMIPYVTLDLEYPPLALLPMLVSYLVAMVLGNVNLFLPVHITLMFMFHVGTIALTYLIAIKIFGSERRALLASVMIALSPCVTYFVLFRYDSFPTLLTVLSLFLYVNMDRVKAYAIVALGALAKWFSLIWAPFYIVADLRNKRPVGIPILVGLVILAALTVPFALLNFHGFLYPYIFHLTRPEQAEGMFYLLDQVTGLNIFNTLANPVMFIALAGVFYMYLRRKDDTSRTMIAFATLAMFLFVMLNKVASPQYIVWITPFLALMMSDAISSVGAFFVLQGLMYYQFPLAIDVIYDPTHYYIWDKAVMLFSIKYIIWVIVAVILWTKTRSPSPS